MKKCFLLAVACTAGALSCGRASVPTALRDDPCAAAEPYVAAPGALDTLVAQTDARSLAPGSVRYIALCLDGAAIHRVGRSATAKRSVAALRGDHELTVVVFADTAQGETVVVRSSHVVDVGSTSVTTAIVTEDGKPTITWRDR